VENGQPALYLTEDLRLSTFTLLRPRLTPNGQQETVVVRQEGGGLGTFAGSVAGSIAGQAIGNALFRPQHCAARLPTWDVGAKALVVW